MEGFKVLVATATKKSHWKAEIGAITDTAYKNLTSWVSIKVFFHKIKAIYLKFSMKYNCNVYVFPVKGV